MDAVDTMLEEVLVHEHHWEPFFTLTVPPDTPRWYREKLLAESTELLRAMPRPDALHVH